jgi:hypothetical protein
MGDGGSMKIDRRKGTTMLIERIYVFQYQNERGDWIDSPIISWDYEDARLKVWKKHRRNYRLMEVIK